MDDKVQQVAEFLKQKGFTCTKLDTMGKAFMYGSHAEDFCMMYVWERSKAIELNFVVAALNSYEIEFSDLDEETKEKLERMIEGFQKKVIQAQKERILIGIGVEPND